MALVGCGGGEVALTEAKNVEGRYISWREHLIDDEGASGIKLRGAVALAAGDLNQDGFLDVVTAYEEARFVRVAYGDEHPDEWFRLSLAEGEEVEGVTDVAIADIDRDGWPDVLAATRNGLLFLRNPAKEKPGFRWQRAMVEIADGCSAVVAEGSEVWAAGRDSVLRLVVDGDPLDAASWKVQEIGRLPGVRDLRIGDSGVVAASETKSAWLAETDEGVFERRAIGEGGALALGDVNGDGRMDVVVSSGYAFAWLERPAEPQGEWRRMPIGSVAPDRAQGLALADLDGDGDLDLLGGSNSGSAPKAREDETDEGEVDPAAPLGLLVWFQYPGGAGEWTRHDIVRREFGAFRDFLVRDLDDDGDLDFLGVRAGSGESDGVFWMQQLHSDEPVVRFQPAREDEGQAPPAP